MNQQRILRLREDIFSTSPVFLSLALAGLSFCFFLGFPFDNHNESFLWMSVFNKFNFTDTLTKDVPGVESFRPLGIANAWLTYRLTNNIYLQQILNWLFALSSFVLLFAASKNKVLFSLLSFIVCGCFFAGYIYLFHLHGVFYGPFQLYVASLTFVASRRSSLSARMLTVVFIVTIVVSLYHTFALLVFWAFIAGYSIQMVKEKEIKPIIRMGFVLILTVIFSRFILHTRDMKTIQELADGFFTSYKMAEINPGLSIIAAAMALLASVPFMKTAARNICIVAAIVVVSAVLVYANIPVLLLWVAICFLRMVMEKNWVLAALIAATTILPIGSGSGSPTYVVFVLMICTFVTAFNAKLYIPETAFLRRSVLTCLVLLFGSLAAIKAGFQVPVLAYVARPVLGEQEKTHQLKDIAAWKLENKDYATYKLILYDAGGIPVNSNESSVNRINRPVADQLSLNAYLDFFSHDAPNASKPAALYITFGDKILKNKELVFSVAGKWNGKACVFR